MQNFRNVVFGYNSNSHNNPLILSLLLLVLAISRVSLVCAQHLGPLRRREKNAIKLKNYINVSISSHRIGFKSLKALIQPAYLARVTSWLAFVVAIFMVHENGDNKGQPRDGASKACWLNKGL